MMELRGLRHLKIHGWKAGPLAPILYHELACFGRSLEHCSDLVFRVMQATSLHDQVIILV
jgi:hypothetical protein